MRKKSYFHAGAWVLSALLGSAAAYAVENAVQQVIYPQSESEQDTRYDDLLALLKTSLEITVSEFGPFVLEPAARVMNESRYIHEVGKGEQINVIWRSTSEKLERELLPIRIPLRKGLLGYRIFLIRKDDQAKFSAIQSLDELKKLSVGQGASWGDVALFTANHMPVVTGTSYEGLFQMLVAGRFDYFSRGVNEAYPEYEARKDELPDLWVEEDLLLYYPWPYYFFVSPKHPELAERIRRGLEKMYKTGDFDRIFRQYHQAAIDRANLKQRRLFEIENPLLPAATPLQRKELWYFPLDDE